MLAGDGVKRKVMTRENLNVMAELSSQQSKDWMEAMIMATIQMALFQPKGWMADVNDSNGMVEVILYYHLGEFITLCLKGREATFPSFLNWAYQKGRSVNEISNKDWRRNCSKACRSLWSEIPRNLKRGRKALNEIEILYSTKEGVGLSIEEVNKYFLEKEEFFHSRGWKKLEEKAYMERHYLLSWK